MFIPELKEFAANWFELRRKAIQLNLFCRLADMKQRAYNKNFYVIVYAGKLRMFSDSELQRKYYYGGLKAPVSHVKSQALYRTYKPSEKKNITLKEKAKIKLERETAKKAYLKYVQKNIRKETLPKAALL